MNPPPLSDPPPPGSPQEARAMLLAIFSEIRTLNLNLAANAKVTAAHVHTLGIVAQQIHELINTIEGEDRQQDILEGISEALQGVLPEQPPKRRRRR